MDENQLQKFAEAAADRAVAKLQSGQCLCRLTPEAQKELPHFLGMVKDIGGGDYCRGVETCRTILTFFKKIHRTFEKAGSILIYMILVAVIGLLLKLFGLGFDGWMGGGK